MPGRLQGKVAIIIGAGCVGPGWGNGRTIAIRFAEEGARVLGVDIDAGRMEDTRTLAGKSGVEIDTGTCDATDLSQVEGVIGAAHEAYGRIDILVNNVGGSIPGGVTDLDEPAFRGQIDYNLMPVYFGCRSVIPFMKSDGGGAIVNMSSASGLRYTGAHQAAYAASKAGVIQLSHVTAVQYAPDGIRVNTVVPGQLHTPLIEYRAAAQRTGGNVEQLLAERQARIPLPFMGDGHDSANAALFLASEEARFITGVDIVVDGGMTLRCD